MLPGSVSVMERSELGASVDICGSETQNDYRTNGDPKNNMDANFADTDKKTVISSRTGKPKRRKAARACIHCQRTHLTCDNNRPCERCVIRGLAKTCEDGIRKKAKYLTDDNEQDAVPQPTYNPSVNHSKLPAKLNEPQIFNQAYGRMSSAVFESQPPIFGNGSNMNISMANTPVAGPPVYMGDENFIRPGSKFQSSLTDMEYSTLSSLLRDNHQRVHHSDGSESSPAFSEDSFISSRSTAQSQLQPNLVSQFTLDVANLNDVMANNNNLSPNGEWGTQKRKLPVSLTVAADPISDWEEGAFRVSGPGPGPGSVPTPGYPIQIPQGPVRGPAFSVEGNNNLPLGMANSNMNSPMSGQITSVDNGKSIDIPINNGTGLYRTPYDVYNSVRQPFPYTPGFHMLVKYIKNRFRKTDLMEIVRSMAKYRPSFIAYSNALTDADLVFLEQCFQRSLLEYEKYFRFSGTPSCIWRRTGQIAAVGQEFLMLTGWSSESLLGSNASGEPDKFIIELMDDRSAVEYFRIFSSMSFGDFRGTMMCDCTLLTPDGRPIRTSSVFTLKRDIFGIPMLIIGNFLPVLTS